MPDLATIAWVLVKSDGALQQGRLSEVRKGKGHGPIWILSVSLGNRRVRQVPVPEEEMKQEVGESLLAFAQAPKNYSSRSGR